MHWGGVDNKHRQKRTFEWIERNADEISAKLSNAVDLIKDERASLDSFDGVNLIMNSTMTKIVSLADPEQKLVIYDGRVGGALGFFVARFTEEREIHQYDVADQLLFAVDREAKRTPETNRIHFPALFGKARDRCHASMVRWASHRLSPLLAVEIALAGRAPANRLRTTYADPPDQYGESALGCAAHPRRASQAWV